MINGSGSVSGQLSPTAQCSGSSKISTGICLVDETRAIARLISLLDSISCSVALSATVISSFTLG